MSIRRVLTGTVKGERVDRANHLNHLENTDISTLLFSGLVINGKDDITIKRNEQPTEALALPLSTRDPSFTEDLFGNKTLELLLKQMLKHKHVMGGSGEQLLLERIGVGTDFANSSVWERFGIDVQQSHFSDILGEGGFNTAYSFNPSSFETAPEYGGMLDTEYGLIFRKSRLNDRRGRDRRPSAQDAVREVIISAYASFHKIGPELIATWLSPQQLKRYEIVDDDAFTLGGVGNDKVVLSVITERWDGDLNLPIKNRTIRPEIFAEQFSNLVRKSIEVGFWQTDCKPHNVLFRHASNSTSNGSQLELAWTDFDPSYCYVLSSNVNERLKACSALAHVASFMGAVSCIVGEDSFAHYLPAVKSRFSRDHGIDEINVSDVCSWLELDNFVHTQSPTEFGRLLDSAKFNIAESLLSAMRNYMVSTNYRQRVRCILRYNDSDPRPTFQQLLDFAYLRTEDGFVPSPAPEVPEAQEEARKDAGSSEALGPYADMLRDYMREADMP